MSRNLFEKIFNYQIMTRLEESDSVAITSGERSWLKMMLMHTEAGQAFTPQTMSLLQDILETEEADSDIREIIWEKAKQQERSIYHPLLRPLRRMIMHRQGFRLTYRTKHGELRTNHSGFPYKLEYSMVKREWLLLWYSARRKCLMHTKLHNILYFQETSLPANRIHQVTKRLERLMEERKKRVVLELDKAYNRELSRILYAFSCFDKTVRYDESKDIYQIEVCYPEDEADFLLSRLRFLGVRVRIAEGAAFQKRMRETALKALARYEHTEENL
ncbi:WYL domain-containing protein [Neobacillus mesonae]|nr:WYL domain-containing protein [Neobacillus mesonae]